MRNLKKTFALLLAMAVMAVTLWAGPQRLEAIIPSDEPGVAAEKPGPADDKFGKKRINVKKVAL